jgi:hypothetical protein
LKGISSCTNAVRVLSDKRKAIDALPRGISYNVAMNALQDTEESTIDPTISCSTCRACCCKLEVMLMGDDDIPPALTERDRWGGEVMRRLEDGWCAALDRATMLCTIYARRPFVCGDYQVGDIECLVERRALIVPIHPVGG